MNLEIQNLKTSEFGNVAKNGWQLSKKKTGDEHIKQQKLPVFF